MSNHRSLLTRIYRLNRHEWLLLLEACGYLVWAWGTLRLAPFNRIAADLGEANSAPPPDAESFDSRPIVNRIAWAIRRVANRMPRIGTCLVRALAARWMLRRRGLPSSLHFGLKKDGDGRLEAHAWLCSGHQVLTGARESRQFTLISTFIEKKGSQNART